MYEILQPQQLSLSDPIDVVLDSDPVGVSPATHSDSGVSIDDDVDLSIFYASSYGAHGKTASELTAIHGRTRPRRPKLFSRMNHTHHTQHWMKHEPEWWICWPNDFPRPNYERVLSRLQKVRVFSMGRRKWIKRWQALPSSNESTDDEEGSRQLQSENDSDPDITDELCEAVLEETRTQGLTKAGILRRKHKRMQLEALKFVETSSGGTESDGDTWA
ncbi:hypothetical protein EDC01DRAFT_635833 [Geopyxis carbonaria]|nr:hypothetical protein EDC01DRAFT_635833 [Geopyxis carbonaria]